MTPEAVTARSISDEVVSTVERGDRFPFAVLRTGAALAVTVLVSLVGTDRLVWSNEGSWMKDA